MFMLDSGSMMQNMTFFDKSYFQEASIVNMIQDSMYVIITLCYI